MQQVSERKDATATGTQRVDRQDLIDEKLVAATAIIDCVRVLTALERSESGFADGHRIRDKSMPVALAHAMELLGEVQTMSEETFKHTPVDKSAKIVMPAAAMRNNMSLGDYLKANGLSQASFGLMVVPSASPSLVSQWCQGVTRITLDYALQIYQISNYQVTPKDCLDMYVGPNQSTD
jgi:hypothetical protein